MSIINVNPQTSVYFHSEQIRDNSPAPKKIGAIWDRLARGLGRNQSRSKINDYLKNLGVTKSDVKAQNLLLPMIQKALDPSVNITPSDSNSGVYFLSKNGVKFAVFKVGEKRARTELLVRHLAHKLGLEEHAVPGLFCSIQNPIFPKDEMVVELYNGNQKVFGKSPENDNFGVNEPYTLTGILEPFIEGQNDITVADFARMTLMALVVGLRDAKMDGMAGSMHLDTEDCMPSRLLPDKSPDRRVAATHLPYLDHPLAVAEIPESVIAELTEMVDNWDLEQLLVDLSKQKVEFADLNSEQLIPFDKELPKKGDSRTIDVGFDHGGCYAEVEHMENILENHPSIDLSKTNNLLNRFQKETLITRITHLRDFFHSLKGRSKLPTTFDMVCSIDPHFRAHFQALQVHNYDRQPASHVLGRYTPEECQTPLENAYVRSSQTPTPPPVLMLPVSSSPASQNVKRTLKFNFEKPSPVKPEFKGDPT